MKKIKIFLIFLVLFISISAVSAEGNFTALQDEIDDSAYSLEITQDYTYDNSTDNDLKDGIVINKTIFSINGNGHTIDASNQATIFNVIGNIVSISNIKLINGYSPENGAAIYANSNIILNNVTFINNNASKNGGALFNFETSVINDCIFSNNTAAKVGGNIYATGPTHIGRSVFINSTGSTGTAIYCNETLTVTDSGFANLISDENGGAIYTSNITIIKNCIFNNNTAQWGGSIYSLSNITIINSTFTNSKSKYSAAVFAQGNISISDSYFVNLYANTTAGAIGIRQPNIIEINNCTFANDIAEKNGGGVYIDMGNNYKDFNTHITNSSFFNCSGDFGGALVQLEGNLTIENSVFSNNTAEYDGGAVYVSYTNLNLDNNTFDSNNIINNKTYNGGAIYCDMSRVNATDLIFTDNDVNAVYAYNCLLNMINCEFENNGESIHAVFSDCELNVTLKNDTQELNDTNYITSIAGKTMPLELINNTIIVETLPSRFDLREWGWVSPVKDQGDMGSCWAFGAIGALESALIKATGTTYDFSENNMQDIGLKYSKYGSEETTEGGYAEWALAYLIGWLGPYPVEFDYYDELGKISPLLDANENIHIHDAIILGPRENATDNDAIKNAIIKYGAVDVTYNACQESPYYNENTSAQYQYNSTEQNHAITVVGWDDNFSASNFIITPPGNGAWIFKNSWGSEWGEQGYGYISYYDPSIFHYKYNIGFIIENTENYTKNYQTDLSGNLTIEEYESDVNYTIYYNSTGNELISAVGTYFSGEDEDYTFEIYVNGVLKHTQNGTAPYRGYHTVRLTKEIPIKTNDTFNVVMTKQSIPIISATRQTFLYNISFINTDGKWKDMGPENKTITLKVYTKELSIYTQDLVKIYKNDSQFEAAIEYANETVTFEINGVNYTRLSDANGTARLNINMNPGNYTIKTTFNGTTVENNIEVLPTLIAQDLVKYYRNASQFYITLIDGTGKAVPNVNITMNINGVFYNRTTNENGTAKLNINLNPGEYILTAIDPLTGLQMSYSITVLPIINATDLEMTYQDGSTFNASVVDGQGKHLVNVGVTFNINGVFYTRYTDSNGIARLNINLMPGEYIITSQYGEAVIFNKITIAAKED
ncbi:C1 family peptidase [Methanobrevibacter sp.]|uniref:C1 family peptidase n=1 Tax=Methanobrevibacter sp. TaxID=66852 RepID=UPI00388F0E01